MKRITIMISLAALTLLLAAAANAQDFGPGQGNGVCQFIDEDGDGFNDLAPDADGDGIPNGLDPDYVKPADGTGNQYKWAYAYGELFKRMFGQAELKAMSADGKGQWGPGDGTGDCIGDGTGGGAFGPGAGTGDGDGTQSGSGVQQQRKGRR